MTNKKRSQRRTGDSPVIPTFVVGDRVVKNPDNWVPNDFDRWGRGIGIGIVVEPPFLLDNGDVDVRWPAGRCFENARQLLPAKTRETPTATRRSKKRKRRA